MLEMAQYHNIPLPKGWPRRVRSAVIQLISLAHFCLTTTRSWAAHSWNARIRLKQDKDRLQQELALLFSDFVGYCIFRTTPIAHSGGWRSRIPEHPDHGFRAS